VRDQDHVDVAQPIARGLWFDTPERADPTPRDRIGEQADTVELDDDRRVPQELEAQRAGQRQPLRAASG
jgi:hypothetical protein